MGHALLPGAAWAHEKADRRNKQRPASLGDSVNEGALAPLAKRGRGIEPRSALGAFASVIAAGRTADRLDDHAQEKTDQPDKGRPASLGEGQRAGFEPATSDLPVRFRGPTARVCALPS